MKFHKNVIRRGHVYILDLKVNPSFLHIWEWLGLAVLSLLVSQLA